MGSSETWINSLLLSTAVTRIRSKNYKDKAWRGKKKHTHNQKNKVQQKTLAWLPLGLPRTDPKSPMWYPPDSSCRSNSQTFCWHIQCCVAAMVSRGRERPAPFIELRSWHSSRNPENWFEIFSLKHILEIQCNSSHVFPVESLNILFSKAIFVCLTANWSICSGHIPVSPPSSASTPIGKYSYAYACQKQHGHQQVHLPVYLYKVGPIRMGNWAQWPRRSLQWCPNPAAGPDPSLPGALLRQSLLTEGRFRKKASFFKEHKGKNTRVLFCALLFKESWPHFAPWVYSWLGTTQQQGQLFHCGKPPCLYWSRKSSSSSLAALFPV